MNDHMAANLHRIFYFIFHFLLCFIFSGVQFFPERLFFFSNSCQELSFLHFCSLTSQFYNSGAVAIVDVVRHPDKS